MDLHGALSRELPEIGEHRGCRLAVARDDVEQPHRLAARPILAGEAHGKDARLHLLGDLGVHRIRQLANWTLTAGTAGCAWYAGPRGRGDRWNTARRGIPRRGAYNACTLPRATEARHEPRPPPPPCGE